MELPGKSAGEIEALLAGKQRRELIKLVAALAALEPHFTPSEVAKARRLPQRTIVALCKRGELRAHKPVPNRWRISLSAVREWDANTALGLAAAHALT